MLRVPSPFGIGSPFGKLRAFDPASLFAPTITASDSLSGRTLTITVDSTTGVPAPTTALTALTLDGVNVLGDATGSDPWTYEVPDSADGQTVAWTVEASNAEGSDTASGSEAVAANLFAPTMTVSTSSIGETFSITIDDLTGTPAPTLAFDVTVDGSPVTMVDQGGGIWSVTVSETTEPKPVVWSVTASNGVSPDDTTSGTDSVSGVLVFPQTLYTSNDQGFVVDAYAASSLWQDDAGTIPATAHDDPVALWKDNSGSTNGVDHSTAVLADRPKLQIVGNRRTILSDGISDKLTSVTRDFTGKDVFTACFAIRSLDTNGNYNPVWSAHDNNDGLRIIYAPRDSFAPVRFQTDNNGTDVLDAPSPTYDPPLDMVIIVEGDIPSGTLKLWIDGTLVASETGVSFVDDWQTGFSRLFSSEGVFSEAAFAKVEIARGMEISRGLTASEFTDLLNWGQAGLDGTVETGVFSPADLFTGGIAGAWYGPSDLSTLFQDSAGTTPVTTAGQPVGLMLDKSGNGNHATQATAAARPTYQTAPARATLDKVDDRLSVTVPTGGFTGTMVLGTDQGTASYGVNIPAGAYDIGGRGGRYFPGNAIVGQLIRDGALSAGDAAATEAYFVANGATAGYGAVTDFGGFWRDWSDLTIFPLIDTSSGTSFHRTWWGCDSLTSFPLIDTSSGSNFRLAWRDCTSLTSFPLIDTSSGTNFSLAWFNCTSLTSFPLIDTSAGTNFYNAWFNCNSLTSFPANAFDNVKGGDFTNAFLNTALTQTSIDNILVSLVTSGIAAGTRVFNQSGGSAPSSTGEAAIDTLRSRGWTVTVTGGY